MIITNPSNRPSERFLQVINSYFIDQGYTFLKSKKSYKKTFDQGYYLLKFDFRISLFVTVNMWWSVTFEKFEKLFAQLAGNPKAYKLGFTMGHDIVHYTRWFNHPVREFPLFNNKTNEHDDFSINQAATGIINFYETYTVPYFDKYNTYEKLERYYNEGEEKHIRGLLLAKYLDRPYYLDLVEAIRKQIGISSNDSNIRMQEFFDETLNYLNHNDIKKALD
jgi:hypothetical protein